MAEVVIAVRGGPEAKSRCQGSLGAHDRTRLVEAMLMDMLDAVRRASSVTAVHVVTPTIVLAEIADRCQANPIIEAAPAGLDAAFELARRGVAVRAPNATLVLLPGDLPGVKPHELECAIDLHASERLVVSPAEADGGTGALVLTASIPFLFRFGPGSFHRHIEAAYACGLEPRVIAAPGLGHDLDGPLDIQSLLARGGHGQTVRLLRALNPRMEAVA